MEVELHTSRYHWCGAFWYLHKNAYNLLQLRPKLWLCWEQWIDLIANRPFVAVFPSFALLKHPNFPSFLSIPNEVSSNTKDWRRAWENRIKREIWVWSERWYFFPTNKKLFDFNHWFLGQCLYSALWDYWVEIFF